MKRHHRPLLLIAGLAAIAAVMSLDWCPTAACRILNIQTYTISSLDDYRQFLLDEAAFTALHHVRAVRMNCSDLREAVVTALNTDRLMLGASKPNGFTFESAPSGPIQAWQQGRLLHLSTSAHHQEFDSWAMRVRESLTDRTPNDLSFLPRLFGGVILHAQKKAIPIVLFSDQPCN